MIRRTPTIIALEANDVEYHLQRIYIRHSLTVEFDQLRLDENWDETDPSASSCIPTDSDVDIDTTGPSQAGSSFVSTSPKYRSYASKEAIALNSVTKSCLKSPIPNQQSSLRVATSTGGNSQADRSVDPPRLKVKFALSLQELGFHGKAPLEEETGMLTSPKSKARLHLTNFPLADQGCRGENHRPNHTDALYTPMPIDSPASTPQVSFLSCGVSSSPATASVPPRDLTLASTMSYEAVLAEGAVSPTTT